MSTTEPKLDQLAFTLLESWAATVSTEGSLAGEKVLASTPLLPAATATATLWLTMFAAAAFTLLSFEPPRDMLATLRDAVLLATKFMPAMMVDQAPEPWQFSTFTP